MSVVKEGSVIRLVGTSRVEDAETVTSLLQQWPGCSVDLANCLGLHAAVLQAILAFAPPLTGDSAEPFLRDLLIPALAGARQRPQPPI